MKFIKQLSEDEFIVKMEPKDTEKTTKIVLAHDYLQFGGRDWTCTDLQDIKGPYGWSNVVNHWVRVQIPIRMAQDILQNVLTSDRKYLDEEHLENDGKPRYCEDEGSKYYYAKDDGTRMVAIYNTNDNKFYHFSEETVNLILNSKTKF